MKTPIFSSFKKNIRILGIRGIPAAHGGFETFAESFSLYLKEKGWDITVYCQEKGKGEIYKDCWQGIHRIHIPVNLEGAKGTVVFDLLSTLHAAKRKDPVLTLGYNTAAFSLLYRLKGIKNLINMDGIEWRRDKWTLPERAWLYFNEKMGAWLGNHLVADHPEINKHLGQFVSSNKISVIPYSADFLRRADIRLLQEFGLKAGQYAILIARPEPENSILEVVRAYSSKKRKMPLVILGDYNPAANQYQKAVMDAVGNDILFVGAIYNQPVVQALRFFCRFYIHGHTVGGTNPSLVEALGAGSPVLAHDNKFNRWVAGDGALYFSNQIECAEKIQTLIENDEIISTMKLASHKQYVCKFTEKSIHGAYEQLLKSHGY